MKGDKDSENKKFIETMVVTGIVAVGSVATVLLSTLGGNTKIEM